MRGSRGGHGAVVAAALEVGHVQFRRGRLTSGARYRIDRSDPAAWRVLIAVDLPAREYGPTMDAIAEHLARLATEHRRRHLVGIDGDGETAERATPELAVVSE